MKKKFEDFILWRLLVGAQRFILWTSSIAVVLAITASVILRYVLKTDLYGAEEILSLLAIWMYFIGGSYGSYEGSHISAEILPVFIKNKNVMRWFNAAIAAISLIVSIYFVRWGLQYWALTTRLGGKTPGLKIPLWLPRLPLLICFVLMVVYNLYHLVNLLLDRQPVIVRDNESAEDKGGATV